LSSDSSPNGASDVYRTIVVAIVLAAVYVVDVSFPLGVAAGMPYVAPVLLGTWLRWRHSVIVIGVISTVLIVVGYWQSPPGGIPWVVFTNRFMSVLIVWITVALVQSRRKVEEDLMQARDTLEARVNERTAELRARETHLRGVMDNVGDGIITIDTHGIIESMNHTAEMMFGYSAEQVAGRNVSLLMPEPYRSEHDSYIARYLNTGKSVIIGVGPREVEGLRKDGSVFPIELDANVMANGTEGDVRFIGVVRDITRRKDTERQLLQAQKMEAIGGLTGGIAHDFNNLLTIILGNLEFIKERISGDANGEKHVATALRATKRGADLTQRLLAFSRRQPLKPDVTDINKLISNINQLISRTLGEHIEIETVLAGGLWRAMIDGSQLENAIINLSINARDAMGDGGKLTIETANTRLDSTYAEMHDEVTPGQYVMVAVTDTGTGMTPEVVERAFEPFFTTKETGKGSGLGLSMVYGFVKQSGGHIKIYSEPGNGTAIKLYLPKANDGAPGTAQEARETNVQPHGDETILVVEDDPDVRAFVAMSLRVIGYTVHEAEDGPSAMALTDSLEHLDMLLTDVVLPQGMNGREIAEAIAARFPDAAILYTSGYSENAIVHHGRLDADAELLVKPFSREALAMAVRRILDRGRQQA
jgi:PAS domain S-box-containing protein